MEILNTLESINFTTLFILFIGLKFTIETYLKYRNINSIKQNEEEFQKDLKILLTVRNIKNLQTTTLTG